MAPLVVCSLRVTTGSLGPADVDLTGDLFNGHLSRHCVSPLVRESEGAEEREEGVRNAMLCFSHSDWPFRERRFKVH